MGGKWLNIKEEDDNVIEPISLRSYEKIEHEYGDEYLLTTVRYNKKWGVVNYFDEYIIQPEFDGIGQEFGYLEEPIFIVKKGKSQGLFDQFGKMIVPVEYKSVDIFPDEFYDEFYTQIYAGRINKKESEYWDNKGNLVFGSEYQVLENYYNMINPYDLKMDGLVEAERKDGSGFKLVGFADFDMAYVEEYKHRFNHEVFKEKDGKLHIYNLISKEYSETSFPKGSKFYGEVVVVKTSSEKYKLLNRKGESINNHTYDSYELIDDLFLKLYRNDMHFMMEVYDMIEEEGW